MFYYIWNIKITQQSLSGVWLFRVSQKVHNFAYALLNFETRYINEICFVW